MDPIAVIGLGCRFPGAPDPEAFWQLLRDGNASIGEIPPDRWRIDDYYDPHPDTPGKIITRWGAFLDQPLDCWDAEFFDLSERDALRMDPQQKLLLEVAWEALEDAGIPPSSLAGSSTGVFVGVSQSDYGRLYLTHPDQIDSFGCPDTYHCIGANRLSYLLNLQGPSLAIDTACSSSLVAIHLACQSLRSAESDLALVGGVSLSLSPDEWVALSLAHFLSPDPHCRTFDAQANGYVRGEGCGVVVLKRLSDAQREGDRIQAVIRGSAVNQSGQTNGFTAPNGLAQQAVIRQALRQAGVDPRHISYLEAHGTASVLGDALEVKSIKSVLQPERSPEQVCWLGSVKPNIGHLEAAAGMSGFLKLVLALHHRQIPPHRYGDHPNPYLGLAKTQLRIPTELHPWESPHTPRLAGVSGLGLGGTNAHVIVEEAESPRRDPVSALATPDPFVLTLSAKTGSGLRDLAQHYSRFLKDHPSIELADVCFTAHQGRDHFPLRLVVMGTTTAEMVALLSSYHSGIPAVLSGSACPEALGHQAQAYIRGELATPWLPGSGRKIALPTYPFQRQLYRHDLKPKAVASGQTATQKVAAWQTLVDALEDRQAHPAVSAPVTAVNPAPQPRSSASLPHNSSKRSSGSAELEDMIEFYLVSLWRKFLNNPSIGVQDNFFEVGGSSLAAAEIFMAIEQRFGKKLPLAALLETPTVQGLASLLRQEEWLGSWSTLVPIQPQGSAPPLFCCHGMFGDVIFYRNLAGLLGSDQPFYGLQAQGLDGKTDPLTSFEEMAALYIRAIKTVQPQGPYYLGGYSIGAVIAFEMAQQLSQQGEDIALLALFDLAATELSWADKLMNNWYDISSLNPGEQLSHLRRKVQMTLGWRSRHAPENLRPPQHNRKIEAANSIAFQRYIPKPYPGHLSLFRTPRIQSHWTPSSRLGHWDRYAQKGVTTYNITGTHKLIMSSPYVEILAEQLTLCLRQLNPNY